MSCCTLRLHAQWVQTSGPYSNEIQALAVSGTNVFAATWNSVYRSTDNGNNWTPVNTGLTKIDFQAFAVIGSNLFVGTSPSGVELSGGVFLSTNNGTSWTEVNTGLPSSIVKAFAVSGTNLFA